MKNASCVSVSPIASARRPPSSSDVEDENDDAIARAVETTSALAPRAVSSRRPGPLYVAPPACLSPLPHVPPSQDALRRRTSSVSHDADAANAATLRSQRATQHRTSAIARAANSGRISTPNADVLRLQVTLRPAGKEYPTESLPSPPFVRAPAHRLRHHSTPDVLRSDARLHETTPTPPLSSIPPSRSPSNTGRPPFSSDVEARYDGTTARVARRCRFSAPRSLQMPDVLSLQETLRPSFVSTMSIASASYGERQRHFSVFASIPHHAASCFDLTAFDVCQEKCTPAGALRLSVASRAGTMPRQRASMTMQDAPTPAPPLRLTRRLCRLLSLDALRLHRRGPEDWIVDYRLVLLGAADTAVLRTSPTRLSFGPP
ncbi:hypothetical protein R3P38DRAFT_3185191 [Favolaschia claudopus]|uniref:Uncharacterized protein n=1 Tax=Favolaschia claudopus TaxID=2862362 RepID=A0AAW0C4T3_9AGAR